MILIQKIFNDKEYKIKLEVKNGLYFYTLTNNDKEIITFNRKDSPNMINPTAPLVRDFVKEMKGKVTFTYIDEEKPIEEEDIKKRVLQSLKKLQQKLDDEEKQQEIKEKSLEKKQKINDEKAAKFWEYHIHKFGLIPVLNAYLDYIHIGDHFNIIRKLIHAYGVITGEESFFQETNAVSEAGKSYEDDILYKHSTSIGLLPEEDIIVLDSSTGAAFRNDGLLNPYIYEHKIIYAGDKGEIEDDETLRDVKRSVKKLITDHTDTYKKDDGQGISNSVTIQLFAESIAWVENSVLNLNRKDHFQTESRTNYYTIINNSNSDIMQLRGELIGNSYGKVAVDFKEAMQKLKTFQSFIRVKRDNHRVITIPKYMRDFIMKKYTKSPVGKREFERHLHALKSLHELQSSTNVVDKHTFEEYSKYFLYETTMNPLYNNLYISLRDLLKVPVNPYAFVDKAVRACNLSYKSFDEDDGRAYYVPIETFFDIQEDGDIQRSLKKLLQLYRLKNSSNEDRYFFTTSDLRHRLSDNKAFKNISDINAALETMKNHGLIDCLEEQVRINGNNYRIWFLLPQEEEEEL